MREKRQKRQKRKERENTAASGAINSVEMAAELTRMQVESSIFGYYDDEDIGQEIWLSVNKALKSFDPKKTKDGKSPKSYFNSCAKNAIRNLKRDKKIIDNVSLSMAYHDKIADTSFEDGLSFKELVAHIFSKLPPNLHQSFHSMLYYGGEGVSPYLKTKLRSAILSILKDDA